MRVPIGDIGLRASSRLTPSRPRAICGLLFFESASWPTRQPSRRDHCGGSDPPRRGLAVNCKVKRLPPPGAAPAVKKGGSLPPPSPLSCGAPSRGARWGHARENLAALCRMGCGKSVPPLVPCGVSEKPGPQRGGLRPLREKRCGCRKRETAG